MTELKKPRNAFRCNLRQGSFEISHLVQEVVHDVHHVANHQPDGHDQF